MLKPLRLATLALFAFAMPLAAKAQDLPAYVIEEFGEPPAVPDGPLAPDLAEAVRVAFVVPATQTRWGTE